MSIPRGLWCVLDGLEPQEIQPRALAALGAGAAALTLRRHRGGDGAACAAFGASELTSTWRATHGRADLALAAGAQAGIAGARSLGVAELVRAFPELLHGASVHDAAEAASAVRDGASFLIFGPVWDTPSKHGVLAPRGVDGLAQAVAAAGARPVIAIGGIERPERAAAALQAGAHACAVLRAGEDPRLLAELAAAVRTT